jgi:hypothetical protein
MVNGERVIHKNIHFKVFASEAHAHAFAAHFRDLTVSRLEGPCRHSNGSWSSRYWGIVCGHDGQNEISAYVTNSESKMRALTLKEDGSAYPGARWASFLTYEQADIFSRTGSSKGI